MASEETAVEGDPQVSFNVKSTDGKYTITISEASTVLDIKNQLSAEDKANVPAHKMRLIYSGRVMKDDQTVKSCNIKPGNTVHMVKNAASNESQKPPGGASSSSGTSSAAAGVPTNMAAGTANNPLAGLTGARYAGHLNLPNMDMFGVDGGMGAPPNEEQVAAMLEDPNVQQTMHEALQNPALVDMMINSIPGLRDNPQAREMINSPEFRRMLSNPEALRHASAMRRMMEGGGGANAFPAPGATDTTPTGAAASNPNPNQANTTPFNPFAMGGLGRHGAIPARGVPWAQYWNMPPAAAGQTPVQTPPAPASAGQATPRSPTANDPNAAANPFASLFGQAGAGAAAGGQNANPFGIPGMPPMTPEMMQQAMQMINSGQMGNIFGGGSPFGGGPASPPAPVDNRPPEERYADQLRQLNDMGFFDFDRNVEALRRSGGSVQGAIEQLLR
ncbi:ubiquitin-domain-containing protein [Mollisia scopiformis]|uniref:Ubiquitin-domain-containing protein n=1 Tax=Mollisia scopiformis TaxID=149040 RepID=A0A194XUW5_MOLSC|nr:ubiquitin-domain-containing protein [Mollisia scopiformis]KUJ24115.1 ubiquitin-domain-containing protein [Mollisia scopiformis]